MDWSTLIGFLLGGGIIGYSIYESKNFSAFFNLHGFVLVVGGTVAAILVNSPPSLLRSSLVAAFRSLFRPISLTPDEAITKIIQLAQKARRLGNMSIQDDARDFGDGFLQSAIDICLSTSDSNLARATLEQKLEQMRARHREISNVFRTMSILFPMFGLLGTLIGIVQVLRNITDPKSLGPSMAVALSTAFLGILMANFFCVPIAGKMRLRSLEESLVREILTEGILAVLFTSQIPSQVSMYLESYVAKRQETAAAGAAAGAAATTAT